VIRKPEQSSKSPGITKSEIKHSDFNLGVWSSILDGVKDQSNSLYSVLKLAIPKQQNDMLVLYFEFELHKNKINQSKHIGLIGQTIEDLTGQKMTIKCQVNKGFFKADQDVDLYIPSDGDPTPHIQTINNIFGAAEMLES
jgi:hypothetical protein